MSLHREDAFEARAYILPSWILILISTGLWYIWIRKIKQPAAYIISRSEILLVVGFHILCVTFGSRDWFYVRYLFGMYPLVFYLISMTVYKYRLALIGLLLCFAVSWYLIFFGEINTGVSHFQFPRVWTLEKVAQIISHDDLPDRYNITENISGDARAMYLRFFVERDAPIAPASVIEYVAIERLYVLTPSLLKTKAENRWELTAAGLQLDRSWDVGEGLKLYRYSQLPSNQQSLEEAVSEEM